MSKTMILTVAGALTALVMTAALILGGFTGTGSAQGSVSQPQATATDVALDATMGTPVTPDQLQQAYQEQLKQLQEAYQRQLDEQAKRIQEMYQAQLESQMKALRQEYERQLQEQLTLMRQQYQQSAGSNAGNASQAQLELLRQQYEQQIQALQAAWAQREQAYQAQLQEAVRRLEAANAQIQALSQQSSRTAGIGATQNPARYERGDDGREYHGDDDYERYEEHEHDD